MRNAARVALAVLSAGAGAQESLPAGGAFRAEAEPDLPGRRGSWARLLHAIDVQNLALAAAVWVLLTAGSLAVVLRVVLALPVDYFEADTLRPTSWTAGRLARNLAGLVLIVVGAVLSIPGIPGQGFLTVLVGVFLVDFPHRQRLERALASRQGVLPALNRLRGRFGRPPLRPPPS